MVAQSIFIRAGEDNRPKCIVEGCDRLAKARHYCSGHWARWRKNGDPGGPIQIHVPQICSVQGCRRTDAVRFRGGDLVCKMHYQRLSNNGSITLKARWGIDFDPCDAAGCARRARSKRGRWCDRHYSRMRRNGTLQLKTKARQAAGVTIEGYAWLLDVSHPLSRVGRVLAHRKTLYDHIGSGEHPCHWCGKPVRWGGRKRGALVVDHLDGDKLNNEIENLVPACNPCNSARGLFMRWAAHHADDPFLVLLFAEATQRPSQFRPVVP